jgi:hypothetical protein
MLAEFSIYCNLKLRIYIQEAWRRWPHGLKAMRYSTVVAVGVKFYLEDDNRLRHDTVYLC